MPVAYTFNTIKTAIKDRMGDQSADFDSKLEQIIGDAEARLLLDLNFTIFDQIGSFSISSGTDDATLPTGCLAARFIYLNNASEPLLPRSMEFVLDYQRTGGGQPKYWAQLNETAIKVAPVPDTTYSAYAHYIARGTPLSSSNQTTWLSNNLGHVLLHSCMIEASKYAVADERLATWMTEYERMKAGALATYRHLIRRDYANISATPSATGAR